MPQTTPPHRPEIAIIGAGIAGLTAAITIGEGVDRLIGSGKLKIRPTIRLYEATNEIGGRTASTTLSNGCVVNMGAEWIHGGRNSPFDQWLRSQHLDLGGLSIDKADQSVEVTPGGIMEPGLRNWAHNRLHDEYNKWKALHPGEDISMGELARTSKIKAVQQIAEERAITWMAVDNADLVSSDEYWGDDTGSGGTQIGAGTQRLAEVMAEKARFYKTEILTRHRVAGIFARAGGGFDLRIVNRRTKHPDYVISTASIGVLKSGGIKLDAYAQSQLGPLLDTLVVAKSTKIFLPIRPEYFEQNGIAPNTFVRFYDRNHTWLVHVHSLGKPIITIFASAAMSELVETANPADIEKQMLAMLERIPLLKGVTNAREGHMLVTNWTTHENFLGAYSAVLPGHKRRNPLVVGNLVFAGEAFVGDLKKAPGQMAGAFESGRIAGRKILAKLKPGA